MVSAALVSACSTFAGPAWQVNDVSMSVDEFYTEFQESQATSSSSTSTTVARVETADAGHVHDQRDPGAAPDPGSGREGRGGHRRRPRRRRGRPSRTRPSQSGAPANPTEEQIEIQAGIAALGRTLAEEGGRVGDRRHRRRGPRALRGQQGAAHHAGRDLRPLHPGARRRHRERHRRSPPRREYAAALAEAEAVVARLATEDFATVSADVSILEEQLPGGDFGCQALSAFPEEVQPLVESLAPGVISAPTRIAGGYLIARVDSRTADSEPPPFEQVEDQAREAVLSQLGQRLVGEWLLERSRNASVAVDPRFGTWDAETAQVVPPEGAATPTVPTVGPRPRSRRHSRA